MEAVEPVVLGTKIKECVCGCGCGCFELPDAINGVLDGEICTDVRGPAIYVSFGIFSVIRIVRPAQLLVQATDYSVPDKDCCGQDNGDSPCDLFRAMAFPTARFRTSCTVPTNDARPGGMGCGCGRNN